MLFSPRHEGRPETQVVGEEGERPEGARRGQEEEVLSVGGRGCLLGPGFPTRGLGLLCKIEKERQALPWARPRLGAAAGPLWVLLVCMDRAAGKEGWWGRGGARREG